MPKIKNLGINVIPETMRPPECLPWTVGPVCTPGGFTHDAGCAPTSCGVSPAAFQWTCIPNSCGVACGCTNITNPCRGVYWRRLFDSSPYDAMPGWCNGSAGQVFLWTLAHRILGDDEWLELAELSAWHTWDEPRAIADLCCGSAGRAYALLNLYRHTGMTEWLSRARQLANHAVSVAASTAHRANSLWKGELGVAVLIAELASPENATMPFFE